MTNEATPSVERLLSESVWLASLARALLGRDEDAVDDVVQEARLAALQSAPADPEHARAWLARVTRNFALRVRLRRSRRERRERVAAVHEAQPSTLDLVARVNAQRRVAAAVVALEEPYRSVVLLRWFDALPVKDVAERLGVPVETVRTRLKRALARLREELDASFGRRDAWAGLLLPWAAPIEGAAAGSAAVTKAAAGAGAATAVGTGVVTMSLATKSMIAAACVVAVAVTWRLLPERVGSGSAKGPRRETARLDGVASRSSDDATSSSVDATAAADATRAKEAADATARDAQPTPPPAGVAITATVVASADDSPVANASLQITYLDRDGPDAAKQHLAIARTDASGRAEVVLPMAEPYSAQWEVLAEGFVAGGGWRFDVPPTAHGHHDLGKIRLERGTLVRGRVLRAATRAPVAGAELRFCRFSPTITPGDIEYARYAGTSAADGSFTLLERVSARADQMRGLYALCDEGLAIGRFRVPPAAEVVDDVEVLLDSAAPLRVHVRDDAGAPVAGATVDAIPHFDPFTKPRMFDALQEFLWVKDPRLLGIFVATTDAEGVANFSKLPKAPAAGAGDPRSDVATTYAIAVRADDHEPGRLDDVALDTPKVTECTVVAPRTRFVALAGRVHDADGTAVPDAKVALAADPNRRNVETDERGEFSFEQVPTTWRSFYLEVTVADHGKFERYYSFDELDRRAKTGRQPSERYDLDIELEKSARIAGRVVDEDGAPIPGAQVTFSRLLRDYSQSTSMRTESIATGPDGRFEFMATHSPWKVHASTPSGNGTFGPTFGPSTECTVEHGDENLVLRCATRPKRAAQVTCEVVDAASGAPLPIVEAVVAPAQGFMGWWYFWKTVTLGRVVARNLFAGRWRIDLELGDHRRASREFEVANDRDDVRLRVEIGMPARVVGRVELEASGAAAVGERARLDWHPSEVARLVDAEGRLLPTTPPPSVELTGDRTFVLDGFVPGRTARVRFTDFDAVFDEVVFTPKNGEVREIVLRPRAPAHVAWKSSLDVSKGWLVVDLASGDEPWCEEFTLVHRKSDKDEPVHTIRPGHYRWRAYFQPESEVDEAPKTTTASGEFDVAAGATHELRIDELR